ncbi:hypothetical protein ACW18Z_06165 [Limosilactobacillus fermentum]
MKKQTPVLVTVIANLAMFVAGALVILKLWWPLVITLVIYVVAASYQFAWLNYVRLWQTTDRRGEGAHPCQQGKVI